MTCLASSSVQRQQCTPIIFAWTETYTLCKRNLAIVFVCVRSIISGFYCHFFASRYKCRSLKKDFWVKNQEWSIATFVLAWRQFLRLADLKDIFDDMRKPKSYCSVCLVTKIKKNKRAVENIWIGYEKYAYKFWKLDVFPLLLQYRLKTAFLIGISWINCCV